MIRTLGGLKSALILLTLAAALPGNAAPLRLVAPNGTVVAGADPDAVLPGARGARAAQRGAACAICPVEDRPLRVIGTPSVIRQGLPELLDAYSLSIDTDLMRGSSARGAPLFQFVSFDGELMSEMELREVPSIAALQQLLEGAADMAVVNRPVSRHQDTLEAAFAGVLVENTTVIGLDALMVMAGSDVPVESLTMADLSRILSGEVLNWAEMGGPDMPISVFAREPGSDARALLESLVTDPFGKAPGAHVIGLDTDAAVSNAIATFPNSIGIARFEPRSAEMALGIADDCGQVMRPSIYSIKSEAYPLTSRISIVSAPDTRLPALDAFREFLSTNAGREVISFTRFLDLRPVPQMEAAAPLGFAMTAGSLDEDRLLTQEKYRAATAGANRLSLVFEGLSTRGLLDPRARADLHELAALVRNGTLDGQEIMLVGLSGPQHQAVNARRDSNRAADIMERKLNDLVPGLEDAASIRVRVAGYGDAMEPACGIDPEADAALRVEVWTKPLSNR